MSDHADDGFPRERYEGPMASLPGTLSVPLSPYIKPALGHGASGLPKENATGHDGCIRGLEKANATIAEQAAEIESLGQTVVKLAAVVDDVDKVLAWIVDGKACDKASDVLGEESTDDGLKLFQIVAGYKALASQHETLRQQLAEATLIDAPELRTERDTLRLELEAQDRYAALEAERDEARRASETVHSHYVLALKQRDEAVADTRAECDKGYEALFQAHQRMVAERDELRLEVARLRDRLLQSLAEGGADQAEAEKQVRTLADELDEANARAESYKVALDAQLEHVQALAHLVNVSQRATSAMVAAGYNRRGGR